MHEVKEWRGNEYKNNKNIPPGFSRNKQMGQREPLRYLAVLLCLLLAATLDKLEREVTFESLVKRAGLAKKVQNLLGKFANH